MQLPNRQFLTGLITEIKNATGIDRVYTIPPKKTAYTYIYLSEDEYTEEGSKTSFIFNGTILVEVVAKGIDDIDSIITSIEQIGDFLNNDTPFFIDDDFIIRELGTEQVFRNTEGSDDGRIETANIRMRFKIEQPTRYDPNTRLRDSFINSLTHIYANDNLITT